MSVEFHGPGPGTWIVSVDGYQVPHVEALFRGGDEDGDNWSLLVDSRFASVWVTRDEIGRWAWLLANMGAICSGYSCHGENSEPLNRFKCQINAVSSGDLARWRREDLRLIPPPEEPEGP